MCYCFVSSDLSIYAETKEILQGWLGSGIVCTSSGVAEFVRQLLAHLPNKTLILFRGYSVLFKAAIHAYNTLRWMALCSGNKILQRWEVATIRTFLIRMAGK